MQENALIKEDEQSRETALNLNSFIVEAPAGAGKTELLTQRFLKLLQTVEHPESVIAITFTNKAASEMRSRIMDSLQMAATGDYPTLPHKQITYQLGQLALARSANLNWRLLETPACLRIYTIDSLSANLARQMPLLSRFGAQPKVTEDATLYYQEAINRTLAHLDDESIGSIIQAALGYFDNDRYRLEQLLIQMLAKRDQWLPYTQSQYSAQAAEQALTHLIETEMQAIADILHPSLQSQLMPIARYAASNLAPDHALYPLLDWEFTLTPKIENLSQWQALVELLLTKSKPPAFRKTVNKTIGLPTSDEAKPFKDALKNMIEALQANHEAEASIARLRLLPQANQHDSWQIIQTLSQLLNIAVAELWLVFQHNNEVDFVEIAQRALLALKENRQNPTDLALRLDYQIQHLLIDEFQDTSSTQIKLIEALTQGWQQDDGRTLFCVGDPMQSIYRFRKANVGLFLQVAQDGIGAIQLTPLKLWRNNRSCPAIVDWVNTAFAPAFPKQDNVSDGAIRYRPFVASKADEPLQGVHMHPLIDDSQTTAEQTDDDGHDPLPPVYIRQLEADKIIQIIQATWQHNPDANIAVLVRARNHLNTLVSEIRQNHPSLNFQAVEIEALANRQIVQDLLSLTYALHQPADRVHWLAILRAPLCGLMLADMHALAAPHPSATILTLIHDEKVLANISQDGQTRLQFMHQVMSSALSQKGRMPTHRWVHSVWSMLNGPECLWQAGDVRDVQAFFERIQQLENTGRFSPQQLAIDVDKLYAAPDAKADEKLQFMTIHKSKGLEFDTVILPGMNTKTGNNEQPLLLWEEVARQDNTTELDLIVAPLQPKHKQSGVTPYDYLKNIEQQRAAYEGIRVLYVAATRAERCLHLLGAVKTDKAGAIKPNKHTFLDMLWPTVSMAFEQQTSIQSNVDQSFTLDNDIADFIPQLIRVNHVQAPQQFDITATANSGFKQSNENKEDKSTLSADIGTLTHFYLELIANGDLEYWLNKPTQSLRNAMHRWFTQQGHTDEQCQQAVDTVVQYLTTTLHSKDGQWVLKPRASAKNELEIEFNDHQNITKRIIDRTFIEDDVRWIIDYKSTPLSETCSESELQHAAEQHQAQLQAYAELFEHEALPIQTAILFLSIGKLVTLDT